eukprot:CAMPEP_0197007836 /NCGR_PEP_ID=MMETSP1380-20130617/42490_1 /TAXON_ID=5936 /ORGANISM="Euplotes crassus, Strain CT5" /LENGTH=32 /DNA_ID= /DNA_START= /DNA_END= /DNA_ORIENTATION=
MEEVAEVAVVGAPEEEAHQEEAKEVVIRLIFI